MITPEKLNEYQFDYLQVHKRLQETIIRDVARRIVKTDFTLTETAQWQAEKLQQSGMLYDEILEEIGKELKTSQEEVKKVFDDAKTEVFNYDDELIVSAGYDSQKVKHISPAMKGILAAAMSKATAEVKNLTMTTAVTSQAAYLNACDLAHMQVISGAFSYQDAIRNAIKSAAREGVKIFYPTGHKSSLDYAVRRSVLTGVNQSCGKLQEMRATELECDLMEITAHSGARPEHSIWQGQIVSRSGKNGYLSLSDIGYGEVTGFQGANCRHNWYMYFEGVSQPSYSAEQLRQWREGTVSYSDVQIPVYEAVQKQRGMERAVRKSKQELVALDEALKNVTDEDAKIDLRLEFERVSVKLKGQEAKLRDFCNKTGLDRDRYREQVFAAKTERGIRNFGKSTSMKAVHSAKKHYSDFVAVVGKENAPSTLDKYYDLKYNNPEEFNKLKELYHGFSSGKLTRNAYGQIIKIVQHVDIYRGEPNSIVQTIGKKGGIQRNYFDSSGIQYKQISNNNHGEALKEYHGPNGEHAHDYFYKKGDNKPVREGRQLTPEERKENADIL